MPSTAPFNIPACKLPKITQIREKLGYDRKYPEYTTFTSTIGTFRKRFKTISGVLGKSLTKWRPYQAGLQEMS